MKEKWKFIPLSGNTCVLSNKLQVKNLITGTIYSQSLNKDGYIQVGVFDAEKGETVNKCLHQIVADVYLGPCPKGKEVDHKDGIKTNNDYKNLRYKTHSKNIFNAIRNGQRMGFAAKPFLGSRKGENNGNSKLTRKDVQKMFKLRKKGRTLKDIARKIGISTAQTSGILSGKFWREK